MGREDGRLSRKADGGAQSSLAKHKPGKRPWLERLFPVKETSAPAKPFCCTGGAPVDGRAVKRKTVSGESLRPDEAENASLEPVPCRSKHWSPCTPGLGSNDYKNTGAPLIAESTAPQRSTIPMLSASAAAGTTTEPPGGSCDVASAQFTVACRAAKNDVSSYSARAPSLASAIPSRDKAPPIPTRSVPTMSLNMPSAASNGSHVYQSKREGHGTARVGANVTSTAGEPRSAAAALTVTDPLTQIGCEWSPLCETCEALSGPRRCACSDARPVQIHTGDTREGADATVAAAQHMHTCLDTSAPIELIKRSLHPPSATENATRASNLGPRRNNAYDIGDVGCAPEASLFRAEVEAGVPRLLIGTGANTADFANGDVDAMFAASGIADESQPSTPLLMSPSMLHSNTDDDEADTDGAALLSRSVALFPLFDNAASRVYCGRGAHRSVTQPSRQVESGSCRTMSSMTSCEGIHPFDRSLLMDSLVAALPLSENDSGVLDASLRYRSVRDFTNSSTMSHTTSHHVRSRRFLTDSWTTSVTVPPPPPRSIPTSGLGCCGSSVSVKADGAPLHTRPLPPRPASTPGSEVAVDGSPADDGLWEVLDTGATIAAEPSAAAASCCAARIGAAMLNSVPLIASCVCCDGAVEETDRLPESLLSHCQSPLSYKPMPSVADASSRAVHSSVETSTEPPTVLPQPRSRGPSCRPWQQTRRVSSDAMAGAEDAHQGTPLSGRFGFTEASCSGKVCHGGGGAVVTCASLPLVGSHDRPNESLEISLLLRTENAYRTLITKSQHREWTRMQSFTAVLLHQCTQREELAAFQHCLRGRETYTFKQQQLWDQLRQGSNLLFHAETETRSRMFVSHIALVSKLQAQQEYERYCHRIQAEFTVQLSTLTATLPLPKDTPLLCPETAPASDRSPCHVATDDRLQSPPGPFIDNVGTSDLSSVLGASCCSSPKGLSWTQPHPFDGCEPSFAVAAMDVVAQVTAAQRSAGGADTVSEMPSMTTALRHRCPASTPTVVPPPLEWPSQEGPSRRESVAASSPPSCAGHTHGSGGQVATGDAKHSESDSARAIGSYESVEVPIRSRVNGIQPRCLTETKSGPLYLEDAEADGDGEGQESALRTPVANRQGVRVLHPLSVPAPPRFIPADALESASSPLFMPSVGRRYRASQVTPVISTLTASGRNLNSPLSSEASSFAGKLESGKPRFREGPPPTSAVGRVDFPGASANMAAGRPDEQQLLRLHSLQQTLSTVLPLSPSPAPWERESSEERNSASGTSLATLSGGGIGESIGKTEVISDGSAGLSTMPSARSAATPRFSTPTSEAMSVVVVPVIKSGLGEVEADANCLGRTC